MSDLTKTRTVLEFTGIEGTESGGLPTFAPAPDIGDDPARMHRLRLDIDVWRDMGEPHTVTMTVEPGDLLNIIEAGVAPEHPGVPGQPDAPLEKRSAPSSHDA